MEWPKPLLDLFDKALDVVPAEGLTKVAVLKALLDESTRRAVWRAGDEQKLAGPALRTPYTPLGSVIGQGINGLARRLGLGGQIWSDAVDAFHQYVEDNAEVVFAAFPDPGEGYRNGHAFGPVPPRPQSSAGEAPAPSA
jgi:hypothetical protein